MMMSDDDSNMNKGHVTEDDYMQTQEIKLARERSWVIANNRLEAEIAAKARAQCEANSRAMSMGDDKSAAETRRLCIVSCGRIDCFMQKHCLEYDYEWLVLFQDENWRDAGKDDEKGLQGLVGNRIDPNLKYAGEGT